MCRLSYPFFFFFFKFFKKFKKKKKIKCKISFIFWKLKKKKSAQCRSFKCEKSKWLNVVVCWIKHINPSTIFNTWKQVKNILKCGLKYQANRAWVNLLLQFNCSNAEEKNEKLLPVSYKRVKDYKVQVNKSGKKKH